MSCKRQVQIDSYIKNIPEMLAAKRKLEYNIRMKFTKNGNSNIPILSSLIQELKPSEKKIISRP